MSSICELVQKVLETGYLTLADEAQLRQFLQTKKYGRDDLNAFMDLQKSAMEGDVLQESREQLGCRYTLANT